MELIEENELKKEYLNSYRESVRHINRICAEIDEIRILKVSISVNYDGMPHGSGQRDLSGYAAKLDGMERELVKERYNRIRQYLDIAARIKQLKSENEKDVLFYRYIKGLDWWDIADKLNYSERQIHRLHGKALKNFELPDHVIECH